jgi:D-alanyl-lipoteichoic acid acyltransferase DltB (MBOAT superfamily)
MIFNSITFLIFLTIVVILYWQLPRVARLWMISIMSLVFYGFWKPQYTLLLIFAAVLDYYVAQAIDKRQNPVSRRNFLILSLVLNLGLLVYFKYLIFFRDNIQDVLNVFGSSSLLLPHLKIILPIGISFYTFETISYTVDVYRRHIKPEKHFISYLSFLLYFPHLIAGPVLRAADILPQFDNRRIFKWGHIIEGFKRIVFGLFLKVALADNISPLVDQGFNLPSSALSAIDVWTLAFLFGFQIYFDFCAYSHIAIGCARLMGIEFFENFNFPYMAVSPKAFWKRWHISLSNWIKDYLYLPLTGKKVHYDRQEAISEIRNSNTFKGYAALFLTWAIMGFWHGANWTFIIWGLYHALLVTIHRISTPYTGFINKNAKNILGWCISLPFLMLGWIPFRAHNLTTVKDLFLKIINFNEYKWLGMRENIYLIAFIILLLVIISYFTTTYLKPLIENTYVGQLANILILSIAVAFVIVFLRPISQFIYFQF